MEKMRRVKSNPSVSRESAQSKTNPELFGLLILMKTMIHQNLKEKSKLQSKTHY